MKSPLPLLSAALALSLPSAAAFRTPVGVGPVVRSDVRLQLHRGDEASRPVESEATSAAPHLAQFRSALAAASVLLASAAVPSASLAVSGGGLDFAGLDLSGQDFSGKNYKGKDFTQVLAKATTFAGSNLQGCRFYNSFLTNANYEGADVRGVSFERANLEGVNFKNANAAGAYFDQSLADVKSLEGGDFTDAQMPDKTLMVVCEREDAKGTNPVTGVDTRESLMCL